MCVQNGILVYYELQHTTFALLVFRAGFENANAMELKSILSFSTRNIEN